jgi:hypothetical protein
LLTSRSELHDKEELGDQNLKIRKNKNIRVTRLRRKKIEISRKNKKNQGDQHLKVEKNKEIRHVVSERQTPH